MRGWEKTQRLWRDFDGVGCWLYQDHPSSMLVIVEDDEPEPPDLVQDWASGIYLPNAPYNKARLLKELADAMGISITVHDEVPIPEPWPYVASPWDEAGTNIEDTGYGTPRRSE